MRKIKPKKIFRASKVAIAFTLLVFCVLVITMAIIGGIIYLTFKSEFTILKRYENVWTIALTFLVASVIIGTIISIFAAKLALGNMDKLVNGMVELSKGDYSVRVPRVEKGVGKELIDSFNLLASELENTRVLRSDFVNEFAHEFKTPIVSLLGFAKILKKENLTEEQRVEYLSIIEEEAERLSILSTNSLNLTKIEKQTILTDVTRFNVSEQIRNCILLFEKKWDRKGLELVLDFDEFFVVGNEELLKQVWINLIDNAIKFSKDFGKIEVEIKNTKKDLIVTVKNSGVEIKEEEREKIFSRFYRSRKASGIEGTGVGLAIVKKIIDLHRGGISALSENGVTCFEVKLPAHDA